MAGTFGYELNPALLSDEEKQQIREQDQKHTRSMKRSLTGNLLAAVRSVYG